MRTCVTLVALLGLMLSAGCRCGADRREVDTQHDPQPLEARTAVAMLERLINLPFRPTSVKWSTSKYHAGEDWSLTAVLTFSPEDIRQLIELPDATGDGRVNVTRDVLEAWFPAATQSDYKPQLAGNDALELVGVQLPGSVFAAPERSPVIHGRALVLEKYNLVYLGLFTM